MLNRDGLDAVRFEGDENRVRQILVNVLGNAVKFTDPGGRVSIECGVVTQSMPEARLNGPGPWACIRVEDTGIGIPPEKLLAIFDPSCRSIRATCDRGRDPGWA